MSFFLLTNPRLLNGSVSLLKRHSLTPSISQTKKQTHASQWQQPGIEKEPRAVSTTMLQCVHIHMLPLVYPKKHSVYGWHNTFCNSCSQE